jgi:hypothetical protein
MAGRGRLTGSRPFSCLPAMVLLLLSARMTPASQDGVAPRFVNEAVSRGLDFRHENGASPEKYMPETMGSGSLIFDYDNDDWPDVFLVNGGSFIDREAAAAARHGLYRNNQDGTFTEVEAAVEASGFGMGACSADYDNDGWPDLYVTSVAGNRLYRNTADGRFTDVSREAGVDTGSWSSSCAFGDIDNDGHVDLYVTQYVDFALDNNKACYGSFAEGVRSYCHPNVYNGVADVLYRNNGDGTFRDVSRSSGIYTDAGKGLGVVFSDFDLDGWIDIYVANDSVPNFLFRNLGEGIFEEAALWSGVAVGMGGAAQAGMGTDTGDVDGDGWTDIAVTNLDRQTHNLYRNTGAGFFVEMTNESGVGAATLPFVGFGTVFFDYDNDGDLDLAMANGDVLDNVDLYRDDTSYEQLNLLLSNDGRGAFTDVTPESGPGFALEKVSRGMAVGDLDNDGDLDVVVSNNGQSVDLLVNDGGNRGNAILVRARGSVSNRDGIGARLRLTVGEEIRVREVKAGSSYLGQNDLRVHFGLGQAAEADRLEISWPSGMVDVVEGVRANQILTVVEGEGVVDRLALARP